MDNYSSKLVNKLSIVIPCYNEEKTLKACVDKVLGISGQTCHNSDFAGLDQDYLGGKNLIESLWQRVQAFKAEKPFFAIYTDPKERRLLGVVGDRLTAITQTEAAILADHMGRTQSVVSR